MTSTTSKESVSTFKGLLPGFTKLDSRPLSHMDIEYFDNTFAPLNCAVAFESNFFGNDKKLRQAFVRAVETSPILCTVVAGEGRDARFVPITSPSDWPVLTIEHLPNDAQGDVLTRARTVMAHQIEGLQQGGKDEHRKSVRLAILKSGKKIAFVMVTPHHFLDGVGIAAFLAKFIMLVIVPKMLWGIIIQKKFPKELPPFLEIPFKKDYPAVKDRLIPNTEMRPPFNHFFPDHDFADPASPGKLKGINGMLTSSSKEVVKQVRKALREEGISISIAFSALAVKLLAVVLQNHNANPEKKQVTSSTGTDVRQFSEWGDERDRQKGQLPLEGNFTCKQNTSFEFEDTLKLSLLEIAHKIKQDLGRLHTDVEYRMDRVLNQWNEPVMAYAGVSSVLAPNITGGFLLRNITLESTIDFGPVPRVWFYVLTVDGGTCLKTDIALPLPKLTDAELRQEMSLIVKDSPLKELFAGVLE